MREFLLAILAGVVATAVYQTYVQNHAAQTESATQPGIKGPVVGASMLTRLPAFPGKAAEAGHGDAVLNANPNIAYTPAFGANTNRAATEWVGPYAIPEMAPSKQYA